MRHSVVAVIVQALGGVCLLIVVLVSGCIVGQAPGRGRCVHLREASSGAPYWLYFPQGYDDPAPAGTVKSRRPLVMTFHGMKPFDSSGSQIREWQQEADRYGFVVCAPRLLVADVTGPLPLSNPNHPSLKHDERNIVAIMDELYRTTDIDPNHVLSTSWSYGGYVAHYMANRYPERFSCIAVKQSNFNENILDPSTVPRYRDRKVAIYYTENDFAICRRESRRAADWYARQGFDLTSGVFEKKGHERTPSVAAEFFARTCGVEARTPPRELAELQIKLEHLDGSRKGRETVPGDGRPTGIAAARPSVSGNVLVRVSPTAGIAPLRVVYWAVLPAAIGKGADLLWTDNGEPMSNGAHGQKVFTRIGDHLVELLVTTPTGTEYRASQTVTVVRSPDKP